MSKNLTLFEEILFRLSDNIILSVIQNLKKMGMQYAQLPIRASHSMCFFNHTNIPFPFNGVELLTFKDEKNIDVPLVYFNIKNNGEITICSHIQIDNNGLTHLANNITLYSNYHNMFGNILFDNGFLFLFSKDLTEKAQQLQDDVKMLENLIDSMGKFQPKISREVLIEKL